MILIVSMIKVCDDCKFKDLKEALKLTNRGDTVLVVGGKYVLNEVIIDKPLVLLGKDDPVIDGNGKYEMLIVKSDSVIIRGFIFKNSGFGFVKDYSALRIKNCTGCIIEGNRFVNNMWAMYWENSERGIIRNNYIDGGRIKGAGTYSGNGIHLWHCKRMLIENNEITGHRDGIYFEFVDSSIIRNNRSYKNARYGLHFMYSNDDVYYDNVFSGNGAVAVMYSKRILMFRNTFKGHWGGTGYGILLKDVYNGEIKDNLFYKNTIGLLFDNSHNLKVHNNVFLENGIAIKLWASSTKNKFYENDFIGNTFDITTNNVSPDVVFVENYYDTYEGYDIDGDGFGDVPHRLVRVFSVLTDMVPTLYLFLKSPLQDLLETLEKAFPTIIPSLIEDKRPRMEIINYGKNGKFKQEI